jgi:hypothetical protein
MAWAGSISGDDHATRGVRMFATRAQTGWRRRQFSCRQPANVMIAERVEHALDELAGGGDLGLVAAAALGDLVTECANPGLWEPVIFSV